MSCEASGAYPEAFSPGVQTGHWTRRFSERGIILYSVTQKGVKGGGIGLRLEISRPGGCPCRADQIAIEAEVAPVLGVYAQPESGVTSDPVLPYGFRGFLWEFR